VTAGSVPSVDRWRASTTRSIYTSVPIVTARSGAPGATRPTSSAPACDGADEAPRPLRARSCRARSHSRPASSRCAGDVHPWIRFVQAMNQPAPHERGTRRRLRWHLSCAMPGPVRPAFFRRTNGKRQEMTGTAGASNPQIRNRASPQVAKSAPRTLSRWRHGFKSRWDYADQRPCPRVVSASGPALTPRRAWGRHGSGLRRRLDELRRHLSQEQIVEVVLVIATANWTNRVNEGLRTPVGSRNPIVVRERLRRFDLRQCRAVIGSLLYLLPGRVLRVFWSDERAAAEAELEIAVLRHQIVVLRRQVKRRIYRASDKAFLAAASRTLRLEAWGAFLVRPETLSRWHRQLVARKWTRPHRPPGRPALDPEVRKLIERLGREEPQVGLHADSGRAAQARGAGLGGGRRSAGDKRLRGPEEPPSKLVDPAAKCI